MFVGNTSLSNGASQTNYGANHLQIYFIFHSRISAGRHPSLDFTIGAHLKREVDKYANTLSAVSNCVLVSRIAQRHVFSASRRKQTTTPHLERVAIYLPP